MKSNKGFLAIIGVVLVLAVVGVIAFAATRSGKSSQTTASSDTGNSQAQAPSDAESTNKVTIADFKFGPSDITVKKGTKVTWTNMDKTQHTVTSDDGSDGKLDSEYLDQGKSYSYTFDEAGEFPYHCTPHPYMKGTVTVTE